MNDVLIMRRLDVVVVDGFAVSSLGLDWTSARDSVTFPRNSTGPCPEVEEQRRGGGGRWVSMWMGVWV